MKLIASTYTFDASAKTVTCSDFATYGLANILLICNVTRGVIVYNPSATSTKGTLSSSTLTLTYDTTSHSDSDVLQIFIDNSATGATSALQTTGNTSLASIDTKTPPLVGGRQPVDGSGVTQPISASALPLPTGAATETSVAALLTPMTILAGSVALHNAPFVDGAPGQIMLAKRRDLDTTIVADGDLNTLNLDEEGRLKVASKPASYTATTGNVTSATSTIPMNTERFSNLMIHCSGTFAGANCTFEGSLNSTNGTDGNWFTVQAIRSNANTIETVTGVLAAAPAYAWELSVNALKYFRIRATAWTSGTQVWTLVPGTYATEPIPGAQVSGTQPVSGTVTATVSNATLSAAVANIGYVGLQLPLIVADVSSAALTTTTTTATLTPTFGTAYSVVVPVTVVSGTNPTLDVSIEESDDTGTNWTKIYDFPRITATGIYRSPVLPNLGNRIRYVQTVTGTTPSFTRSISRLQRSDSVLPIRQIVDRTIAPNTLNSTTPNLTVQGTRNAQLVVNVGAITTTAPALQLEGSDDNGGTWYAIGSPLTAVASTTVQITVSGTQSQLVRARVSTAGVGVTAGYVLVKGF